MYIGSHIAEHLSIQTSVSSCRTLSTTSGLRGIHRAPGRRSERYGGTPGRPRRGAGAGMHPSARKIRDAKKNQINLLETSLPPPPPRHSLRLQRNCPFKLLRDHAECAPKSALRERPFCAKGRTQGCPWTPPGIQTRTSFSSCARLWWRRGGSRGQGASNLAEICSKPFLGHLQGSLGESCPSQIDF